MQTRQTASGEINADRSNHPYGTVTNEPRRYGECNFEIMDSGNGTVAEPAEGAVRSVLARAMLYMSQVYGADVKIPLQTIWKWHTENPPKAWEVERAKIIAERTGLKNEWTFGAE